MTKAIACRGAKDHTNTGMAIGAPLTTVFLARGIRVRSADGASSYAGL